MVHSQGYAHPVSRRTGLRCTDRQLAGTSLARIDLACCFRDCDATSGKAVEHSDTDLKLDDLSVEVMVGSIGDHRGEHGVEPICKFLPIAPSTYHGHLVMRPDPSRLSDRARRNAVPRPEIARVFGENWRVYGVRKVWRQLDREGCDVARCTFSPLMKGMGIQGIIRGKLIEQRCRTERRHAPWTR